MKTILVAIFIILPFSGCQTTGYSKEQQAASRARWEDAGLLVLRIGLNTLATDRGYQK